MKIVIVGAGISGLSAYLFLKKHLQSIPNQQHEINIYEAYDVSKYILKTCTPALDCQQTDNTKARSEAQRTATAVLGESTFTPEAIASAIGISRNGLDVLSRLFDEDSTEGTFSAVLADMIREGHPATKWRMSNARGWLLADINMLPKRLQKTTQTSPLGNRSVPGTPTSWKDSQINNIMISRQAFWSILLRHVVKDNGPDVIKHKKVLEIVIPPTGSNERTLIRFSDGSEGSADLVIGADGLRSAVRKAMFQPGSDSVDNPSPSISEPSFLSWLLSLFSSSQTTQPKDFITPHYEGLVGVGSFVPSSLLSSTGVPSDTMSIVFGPNGFFGYGYITSSLPYINPGSAASTSAKPGDVAVFWSTFGSESENPFPLAGPTDKDRRAKPYEFDRMSALKALVARHRSWKNSTIQAIISHVEKIGGVDGFYPTWTTPELPTWSKNGKVVLVGDAAHALQPSSGQGACQALEDAEALSLLLKHYLSPTENTDSMGAVEEKERKGLAAALKKFDKLRIPRLKKIYVRSQKMSGMKKDLGWIGEMFMYGIIWVMTKFHDKDQEELINYDVPREVGRIVKGDSPT